MSIKLVVNNIPKKLDVTNAVLKGNELHKRLETLGTVQAREQFIIDQLRKQGFE